MLNVILCFRSVLRDPATATATNVEMTVENEIANSEVDTKDIVARRLLGERLELLVELQVVIMGCCIVDGMFWCVCLCLSVFDCVISFQFPRFLWCLLTL